MERALLQEKISRLSEELQQQVVDYVDFLIERYHKEPHHLTEGEKQTLEKRLTHYKNDPSQAVDVEKVKDRLLKKYELPGQS